MVHFNVLKFQNRNKVNLVYYDTYFLSCILERQQGLILLETIGLPGKWCSSMWRHDENLGALLQLNFSIDFKDFVWNNKMWLIYTSDKKKTYLLCLSQCKSVTLIYLNPEEHFTSNDGMIFPFIYWRRFQVVSMYFSCNHFLIFLNVITSLLFIYSAA